MILTVLPSDLRLLAERVLILFNFDSEAFRKNILFQMRGSSLNVIRSSRYFKYSESIEAINLMSLYACKRTIDKIFLYIDLPEADRRSKDGNRYLYRLSDVSSFGEAMQKELAIGLHLDLYNIFHYLYSHGHLDVTYLETHIEIFFDLGSMTEEEGRLCLAFIMVETSRY